MRHLLQREAESTTIARFARHRTIYALGEKDAHVFFILRGQVKLLMSSPEGKESIVGVRTPGDIIGMSCLAGLGEHLETAVAMEDSVVRKMLHIKFLKRLRQESLLESFIQYLCVRIVEQQESLSDMIVFDGEKRLGVTLLQLARQLGKSAVADLTRIEPRITHEELSAMVGTTRPRITEFMKRFRQLGLVEVRAAHSLLIDERRLAQYVNLIG